MPEPVPVGTLSSVSTLVVTDTFGIRTLIRPSEDTTVSSGETPWTMFKLSGNEVRSNFIVLGSTLGVVEESDALEEVLFLRDDMAAMAWAVENQLQGDLDVPVDGSQRRICVGYKRTPRRRPRRPSPAGRRSTTRSKFRYPITGFRRYAIQIGAGAHLYLRGGGLCGDSNHQRDSAGNGPRSPARSGAAVLRGRSYHPALGISGRAVFSPRTIVGWECLIYGWRLQDRLRDRAGVVRSAI